ncbi:MAG: nucleotidyltransferase family protein [Gammaproteobacteria bacterium]|nr:MAG: nucleotidyltransferase family protein [Gammaproteobacteria bacterium]
MSAEAGSAKTQPQRNRAPQHAAGVLIKAIREPTAVTAFTDPEWDLFIRLARREGLLARVAIQFEQAGTPGPVPKQIQDHMIAARAIAANHAAMIRWEVDRIQFALRSLDTPILLLKGAAYLLVDLPLAQGRLVSDVDILVPEGALHDVEAALLAADWAALTLDPYDQRYYRRWMHELPPLRHRTRGTTVDVHHRILPQTSRLNPDPALLWEDSVALDQPGLRVLSPEDMLLHCAVHLFHDGDLDHGLRDLVDLHDMFGHFGKDPQFWTRLTGRAQKLGVARPLFYALRYTERVLGTKIPTEAQATAAPPRWPLRQLMDQLVMRALTPEHPDHPAATTALARWLLYIRSHYLRMPLNLLIPHLLRKSFRKRLQPA